MNTHSKMLENVRGEMLLFIYLFIFIFAANVGINCNFENNLCTWTQDKTDQFDWTRKSGSTASSSTGPSVDHTKGTCKQLL